MTENEKKAKRATVIGCPLQTPGLLDGDVAKLSLNNRPEKGIELTKATGAVSKKYKIRHPTDPFPDSNLDGRQKSPCPSDKKRPLSTSDSHLVFGASSRGNNSSSGSSPTSVSSLTPGRKKPSSFNVGGGMNPSPKIPVVLSRSSSQDMSMMGTLNEDLKTVIKSIPENTSNVKASPTGKSNKGGQRTPKKEKTFETYMMLDEVQQGLKKGELIEGVLRINPKNFQDAYISVPGERMDIYLGGILDRNRALNGDVVVVKLKPKDEWKILTSELRNYLIRNNLGAYLTAQPNKHVKKPRHGRNLDQIPEECSILGEKKDGVKSKKTKKARRKRGKKKKEVDGHNREIKIESSSDIKQISSKLEDSPETMENYLALDSDVERHLSISKSENTNFEADLKITNISDHSFLDEVPHGDVVCQMTVGNISTCSTDCTPADICKPTSTISFPIVDNFVPPDSVNSPFCNTGNSIASTYSCKTQDDNIALPISASVEVVDNWESAAKQSRVAILQLEDLMVTPRMDVVQESDFFSDVDSTDGDAVPPDQLSEQDDSMSDSERSVNSNDLQQAAEDDQFFESSYNCNQNLEQTVHIPAQDAASTINESPNENASNKNSVVDGPERFSSTPTDSSPSIIAKEVPNCVLPNACSSRQFLDDIYFCQQKRVLPAHEERNSNPSLSDNLPDDILNFLSILKLKSIKNLTPDKVLSFPYGQKFIQRTAKVVYILEKKHTRITRGNLRPMQDNNPNWAIFSPLDHRVPRIKIPMNQCPQDFLCHHEDYGGTLFVARIIEWETAGFATGCLEKPLGSLGEIDVETEGILIEYGIDFAEFSEDVYVGLPREVPWTIPEDELRSRRDFRQACVFTIDPATARDLDDALSCECLGDGRFRVGVHIADVSHFVKKSSQLDSVASQRASSVYLVQTVVPMLPRLLCEELCSLNPGQDRLTFSVEWIIREDGAILSEWFGKSLINSCIKLSYDHAQSVIENSADVSNISNFPSPIFGNWTFEDIRDRILWLNSLATKLRQKRARNGSLHLDQVKVNFHLERGLPLGYVVEAKRDSNRLIEEFMLLANMAVAHKIYKTFPKLSLLRCHPPPLDRGLDDVVEILQDFGIHLNSSSSGSLQESLNKYIGNDEFSFARHQVITMMLAKPMKRAVYCCSGSVMNEDHFWHYALNVPLYTHFTSPIRRYPDVLVHRLLAAALGYDEGLGTLEEVRHLACHCNDKKAAAKQVQELSTELFLAAFIRACGPLEEEAMVCAVMDRSFDVLVLNMGLVKRIYCEQLSALVNMEFVNKHRSPRLYLVFSDLQRSQHRVVISVFTRVMVILSSVKDDPLQFKASFKCLI